jgi:hypothetical protein
MKKELKASLGCISFIIISFILLLICVPSTEESKDELDKHIAYNYAMKIVKSNLKSPSTAKFPSVNESLSHINQFDTNKFQINSYVDSQNSFGATVRSNFEILVIIRHHHNQIIYENLKIY